MMKKKYLLALIFLASISLHAQMYYGFKVGVNLSDIKGDNLLEGMKPGMHVGGVVEFQVSDKISVQPELMYSIQGSQDKDDANLKNNNHYMILPVMIKYFLTDLINTGDNFLSIDAGPQVGYLVFAKTSNGWQEWEDKKDQLNALDYGVNIGASYEMDNGMNINIRYNYNFANIYKPNDFDLKANNTNIQISLGYKFY